MKNHEKAQHHMEKAKHHHEKAEHHMEKAKDDHQKKMKMKPAKKHSKAK